MYGVKRMPMHRTQVYFPEEVLEILREEAEKKNTTLAQVIRKKVESQTPAIKKIKKKKKKYKNAGNLLRAMAEEAERLGFSGPKDLATNPDKYLYGS